MMMHASECVCEQAAPEKGECLSLSRDHDHLILKGSSAHDATTLFPLFF